VAEDGLVHVVPPEGEMGVGGATQQVETGAPAGAVLLEDDPHLVPVASPPSAGVEVEEGAHVPTPGRAEESRACAVSTTGCRVARWARSTTAPASVSR
jgi:hypothetical protein